MHDRSLFICMTIASFCSMVALTAESSVVHCSLSRSSSSLDGDANMPAASSPFMIFSSMPLRSPFPAMIAPAVALATAASVRASNSCALHSASWLRSWPTRPFSPLESSFISSESATPCSCASRAMASELACHLSARRDASRTSPAWFWARPFSNSTSARREEHCARSWAVASESLSLDEEKLPAKGKLLLTPPPPPPPDTIILDSIRASSSFSCWFSRRSAAASLADRPVLTTFLTAEFLMFLVRSA
mmetsp:Transcript_32942/g.70137  ORF Transcript_32942/g.70137 Transcript_32942/m.70137 type:complete len:248 (-) Transcript_32942:1506-2249(-)